jgi:CheY-like chemotaxis protein
MDDMMPKMSGTETFKKLKQIDNFNVPVVALTANAITGMREKYLSEGFDDYISKPIDKKDLERVLNKYLI